MEIPPITDFLPMLPPNPPLPPILMRKLTKSKVQFAGFATEMIQTPSQTTTRQRDGATAYDFQNYPLIDVTTDVSGKVTVLWGWANTLDGTPAGHSGGQIITNAFDVIGGRVTRCQLVDNRPPPEGNVRNGSLAFGDPDGLFDGLWHRVIGNLVIKVTSPLGAVVNIIGTLDETFKTVAAFSAAFAGWQTVTK